ncbi:uncharacterized protein LOC120330444 isoform X2 [Styela clava]
MNLTLVGLCFGIVFLTIGSAQNFELSYLAEQINSYCELKEGSGVVKPKVTLVPKVGKAGPPGQRGPRGAPGVVDYNRVDDLVEQKLSVVEQELSSLKNSLLLYKRIKIGMCPMEYRDKCYWVIKSPMTAVVGRSICQSVGGQAADIVDADHFEILRKYISTIATNADDFWTGMNFNTQTRTATLFDGSAAPYVRWHPGYPNGASGRTVIAFNSEADVSNNNVGMWDYYPDKSDNKQAGVICEI